MKNILSIVLLAFTMVFVGCDSDQEKNNYKALNPKLREVVVNDVVQTSAYTYLEFEENSDVYWAAVSRRDDIRKGDVFYFDNWMEMKNFTSKELDKTFESIYFIEVISNQPFSAKQQLAPQKQGSSTMGNMEIGVVAPVEGGITIAELYANKEKYKGQKVKVRGQVVKFTAAVMQKNWIHLQDGTADGNDFDLTITTNAIVEVGDVAILEGTVVLDKDFGYGYSYEVLMENAVLLGVEKTISTQ